MSSRIDNLAHLKIPLQSILSATNNFDDKNVIVIGGYDKRYRGQLSWSGELIKIKARRYNKDRDEMFWTEVSMLSCLKHQNLVSLLGFCYENGEKIIITKREIQGSLSFYLSDATLLTWVQRLKISVGLAHALSYIHYDEPRDFSVIHRGISSITVLLNDNFEPKLSFFERSMKIEASLRHHSFHTSKVWSANGYRDPTYEKTKSVNHKTDMYSFGIVLFELLCGRTSIIANDTNKYLVPAAILHYKEKKLDKIIDWDLWKQMDSQSFDMFAETAYECLNEEESQRPSMDEIVTRLEKVLELQLKHRNKVILKDVCTPQDMLKSMFHVSYLYWLEKNVGLNSTGISDDCGPGGMLQISLEYVEREFNHAKRDGELAGWVTDSLIARPKPHRIRPGY